MHDDTAVTHAAYYRRQARTCLQLARNAHDPALRGRLLVLANEFDGKAAACEEEAFILRALKGDHPPIPA